MPVYPAYRVNEQTGGRDMARKTLVPLSLRLLEAMERNPELQRLSRTKGGKALRKDCLKDLRNSVKGERTVVTLVLKWICLALPLVIDLIKRFLLPCKSSLQSNWIAGTKIPQIGGKVTVTPLQSLKWRRSSVSMSRGCAISLLRLSGG